MRNKLLILIICGLIISISCQSQITARPKKIKVKGDYIHNETKISFPEVFDEFSRIDIYAFDKKQSNVGVSYENITKDGKTTLTIYVYPAGPGSENRLRGEYLRCLQSAATIAKNGIDIHQHSVSYSDSGYRINGFKAEFNYLGGKSLLTLFECGHWFFKIRITTSNMDQSKVDRTETHVLDLFVPSRLVQMSPLNSKADLHFAPAAFRDSLMLGCVMGSTLEKVKWALANVDSLQRESGFPDLYLDMHIASLNAFVNFEKNHPKMTRTQPTIDYLNELKSLIDSGYLDEFLMSQYQMVMIVPENMIFDFQGFEDWKKSNPTRIDLSHMYSVIEYK
jgi:hypothetical protein